MWGTVQDPSERRKRELKHKVRISVSDRPQSNGAITCRSVGIRERILHFLLGDRQKVTVLIPGDSVGEIAICEAEKGESTDGKSKTDN